MADDNTLIEPVRHLLPNPDDEDRRQEAMFWEFYNDVPASMRDLISRATSEPKARELLIEEFRKLGADAQDRMRRVHQHHLQQQTEILVRQLNGSLAALRKEHDAVMCGEKVGCRSLAALEAELRQEVLRLKLWVMGGLVSRLVIPTVVGILVGIAVALITGGSAK